MADQRFRPSPSNVSTPLRPVFIELLRVRILTKKIAFLYLKIAVSENPPRPHIFVEQIKILGMHP